MLKKLLKYDFGSILRLWWIAALASVLISIAGGIGGKLFFADRDFPVAVQVMSMFILILALFASFALLIFSFVLVFLRFYRNFFTDEGYLTFTLPVSRGTLLNAKLICGVVTMAATVCVCLLNVFLMLTVANAREVFEVIQDVWNALENAFGGYLVLYIPLGLILLGSCLLCAVLFVYICVTFAATVAKKAKLLAAIGIYYGANCCVSFGLQLFQLFGSSAVVYWLEKLNADHRNGVVLLMLLAVDLTVAIVTGLLYILQITMLEKKLNLS